MVRRARAEKDFATEAGQEFDELHHYSGMIEGIFGAEGSDEHNIRTRSRIRKHREK